MFEGNDGWSILRKKRCKQNENVGQNKRVLYGRKSHIQTRINIIIFLRQKKTKELETY